MTFSQYGGNPVSCAVANAVLDVIEEEQLLAQASRVGEYLMQSLRVLGARHVLVGDVRGLGLFSGVELVLDREERTPATLVAQHVVSR